MKDARKGLLTKQKTILCVDDDTNMLSALKRLLGRLPFRVVTASGGKEGIETAIREKPDLVFLDLMMPGIDGFEVLSQLRQSGLTVPPVIMLTGWNTGDAMLKGYREGCVYYLTKPFKNEHVINVVQYLIGDLPESEREQLALKL